MANTFNTGVYKQEWETRLQDRLNKPTTWKEVCDVRYTDTQIINWPYMSTEFSITTGTRGTAYTFSDFALTNSTLTINAKYMVPVFVDKADMAQCTLVGQMEIADRQSKLISEQIETVVLAAAASATNFGDTGGGALGLASTAITVTSSNIDDIIRGVIREIRVANGQSLADEKGIFFVWRPADFEKLEQFMQANGFNTADLALKNGGVRGMHYMGADHYVSNSHTAGHLFAGVKKILRVGILKATWGKVGVFEDPADGDGQRSGWGIVSRLDMGTQIPAGLSTIIFDVNVA